jgi:hypothetical protein
MKDSGVGDALKSDGQFTVFAPTNAAMPAQMLGRDKAQPGAADGLSGGAGKI